MAIPMHHGNPRHLRQADLGGSSAQRLSFHARESAEEEFPVMAQLFDTVKGLVQEQLGSLMQAAGQFSGSESLSHAGRRDRLAGLVLRHGGLSRDEALRHVGSFKSAVSSALAGAEPSAVQAGEVANLSGSSISDRKARRDIGGGRKKPFPVTTI